MTRSLIHAVLAFATCSAVFALHWYSLGPRQQIRPTPAAVVADAPAPPVEVAREAGALTANEIVLREGLLVTSTDRFQIVETIAELYANYCCLIGEKAAVVRIKRSLRRNRHVAQSKVQLSSAEVTMTDGTTAGFMLYTCRPPCANPLP